MAACNATDFIALVVQHEILEGLDEIVACIYSRALASIPTGAPILQSPICLFFCCFHFPLQEISEIIRRIKEETSIQCFQSSDSNGIVQCFTVPQVSGTLWWVMMFAWISSETKWCWLNLGKLLKMVKIISVLQTGTVWSLPYPGIFQIIWNTKASCSDSCWDIYSSAFASWPLA